jgi:Na+/alanine symporter
MVVIQWHISFLTYVCPSFIGVYYSVTWFWKLANLNTGLMMLTNGVIMSVHDNNLQNLANDPSRE